MNFLFHMYLSGDDPELLVGNFMGDFVKGPLDDRYPDRIQQGLLLHRKIDSFAHGDRSFQSSKARLSPHYGLYRGVLVDLFYDHFLAREWNSWHCTSLHTYLLWARTTIERHRPVMPEELQGFIPIIFDQLLPSYSSTAGIASALQRMSRRVRRSNPLADGGTELLRQYAGLRLDFEQFIQDAQRFADAFRNTTSTPPQPDLPGQSPSVPDKPE